MQPHQDGPLYVPSVCIVSCGAPAVLRFWRRRPDSGGGGAAPAPDAGEPPDASVLLMPRSLVVFSGEAYDGCYHGIREAAAEELDSSVVNLRQCGFGGGGGSGGGGAPATLERGGERVSFTVRRVRRVQAGLLAGLRAR